MPIIKLSGQDHYALKRVCQAIARHTYGFSWQELYQMFAKARNNLNALEKDFELHWYGPTLANGQPRFLNESIAKLLWMLLYPSLIPETTRFQYSKKQTINPWNARPSHSVNLPISLRVEQDVWFNEFYQLEVEDPDYVVGQSFDIIWEDD